MAERRQRVAEAQRKQREKAAKVEKDDGHRKFSALGSLGSVVGSASGMLTQGLTQGVYGVTTGIKSAGTFLLPNSLLEIATKAGQTVVDKTKSITNMFQGEKRALSIPAEEVLPTGTVFSVRKCEIDAVLGDGRKLPQLIRNPDELRRYAFGLAMTEFPGMDDEAAGAAELRRYVTWALGIKTAEWDAIAAEIGPQLELTQPPMQLEVDLVRGIGLRGKDTDGLSDPYSTLQVQANDGKPAEEVKVKYPPATPDEAAAQGMQVSRVVENVVNPEWEQEFVFALPAGAKSWNDMRLHITVWDSDDNDRRLMFNPKFVGRVFKDAARKVTGKGADDFLGHAVLELHRIPRGGLFLHRLQMRKRSQRSHVGGCIEITARFTRADGTADLHSPLFSNPNAYGELLHRIVLCEAPLWGNADGMWDCSISKWAQALLAHGVLAGGLSTCQKLACELEALTFCNKNPDLPDVEGAVVTTVLSKLLDIATNDSLTDADADFLTTAVTNHMAERAEDLQYFLDEWRFERNDRGEAKLRNVIELYSLCFTILRLSTDTSADEARRQPPRKEVPTTIRLQVHTLTGKPIYVDIEPTDKVAKLKDEIRRVRGRQGVPRERQQLTLEPVAHSSDDKDGRSLPLKDDRTVESYGMMEGGVLFLMDTELQDAVKKLMRRAFAPRFKHLVQESDKKALEGHESAYSGHEIVASIQLVQSALADLTVLQTKSAFRGVLERFGGVNTDLWAFQAAIAIWDQHLSELVEARLPKHNVELSKRSKDDRDAAMSLSQFSFKLYFELKAFVGAVQPIEERDGVRDVLSIYRYPAWFIRQIENYFLTAQEQGKERMLSVVTNDTLEKFAGQKYSASVRDLLKIAYEVLDTWDSLGPGQWTQMTLDDTLIEDAMAWNVHLSNVITELVASWLTEYKARFAKLVAGREMVVVPDKDGRAVVTEAGCTALNNVCEVKNSVPELKQKIEAILVQLHQQQVKGIKRILRLEPAKWKAIVAEKEAMATGKLNVLDCEFEEVVRQCEELETHIIDAVTGEVSRALSTLLLDACVSFKGESKEGSVDAERIMDDLNPPLDYLYSNLGTVVQEHCFDETYVAVRNRFWEATLRAMAASALSTHSMFDRVQLGQKYSYLKDEFKHYGMTDEDLARSPLHAKVDKVIELKMSDTLDVMVDYLALLAEHRPTTPTALGTLTVAGTVKAVDGEPGEMRKHSVTVMVQNGKNMVAMDKRGTSDPVVQVTVYGGDKDGRRHKTSVQRKTLNPEWNEALFFEIEARDLGRRAIHFQIFDIDDEWQDKLKMRGAPDPMGECSMTLKELDACKGEPVTMHLTGSVPPEAKDESRVSCPEIFQIIKIRAESKEKDAKDEDAKKIMAELKLTYEEWTGKDKAKWRGTRR